MVILLIICIPVSIALTGFIVLKSVQLGLRWQIQGKEKQRPTMEKNPIQTILEQKEAKKEAGGVNEVLDEWLNGGKG